MDVNLGNDTFLFEKLTLTPPNGIVGGSYLTKYSYKGSKNPLYIQTPTTHSKQGIVVAGKKAYIDILLTNEHADFIEWITNLERTSIDLLYEKRHLWFTEELDKCDIENSFTPPIRPFKNGQNYLIRVNLELSRITGSNSQPFLCKVFNENRQVTHVDYIKPEQQIISIIEFQGIKFTRRSFQVELYLRQVLVVPSLQIPLFETCVISPIDLNRNSNVISKVIGSNNYTEAIPDNSDHSLVVNSYNSDNLVNNNNLEHEAESEPGQIKLTITEHLGEDSAIKMNTSLHPSIVNNCTNVNDSNEQVKLLESNNIPLSLSNTNEKSIKHFELAEVDIDFKNIPDAIDIEQPTFGIDSTNKLINERDASVNHKTIRTIVTPSQHQPQNNSIIPNSKWKNNGGNITLKKHKEVIYEMYKVAKIKAQEAKKAAIRAYLEAKEIKATYMLDDLEDSDIDSDNDNN